MTDSAKWISTLLAAAIFLATFPAYAEKQAPADLVIVYTGDGRGNIEPTGCCYKIGGMARRATRIREIREKHPNVLVVDVGNFFGMKRREKFPSLRAEHVHRALSIIDYDVLNVADTEMSGGKPFEKFFRSDPILPLTSLNVTPLEAGPKEWPLFRLLKAGNLQVAFIGIADWPANRRSRPSDYMVHPPAERLQEHLAKIRKQADVIVLLSHIGWESTRSLIGHFPDIDIAISGYDVYPDFEPEKIGRTLVTKNPSGGGVIGVIRLWADETRRVRKADSELMLLEMNIHPDPEYLSIETDFAARKSDYERRLKNEEQMAAIKEELARFSKMSPKEFLEQMKTDNRFLSAEEVQNPKNME
jgi:2',3'-cyclic-nucleotide 2'-phosphodiesterase (5'-nucleotidase family)